jgi:tetratricopeptide (TPR) repeat protein
MAVCYYNQQLMEEALSSYKKVYAKTSSEYDIEAGLKIGEILFQQAKYADAEKHLRTAIKSMGSDKHRLALSFILLSDIYVAMDNLPQAKSMLNTVISKHTGEDLILVAKQKLDQITEMEREKNQRKFEQEMILENQGDNGNN